MKETTGLIKAWDPETGQGMIQGDDENTYPFTKKEWAEKDHEPEIDEGVLVICQNGRDASKVEYLNIEHMPQLTMTIHPPDGKPTSTHSRFIGGPWRMRSDSLAWMLTAKGLHSQISQHQIKDISELLRGEHIPISIRGSVIKYCYGFSIELYLKWILNEANIKYDNNRNHRLKSLTNKLPDVVINNLRKIYSDFYEKDKIELKMMQADVRSVRELQLDWSTFDKFIENIDSHKFIIGRYATLKDYSIFPSSSNKRSTEMNSYIDSNDFFDLANAILSYKPSLADYKTSPKAT